MEDIKAPEAFEIERRLKEELNIPIMHDDQHGTAIITSAALLNALELARKRINRVKVVVSGAGASAISCAKLYMALGVLRENIFMYDSKGLIWMGRKNLDEQKQPFAIHKKDITLEAALKGADVFLGLSKGNIIAKEMIKSMAKNPIVFALANPDPEIPYKDAIAARPDVIMATGRSDHPNQVNNVLGFPFILRGALDVRATCINEEMKLAAVKAIANLAKESVPEEVNEAYGDKNIVFGRDQFIPKPLDPRLIYHVAPAVAKAAMDSGVAKNPIANFDVYVDELKGRLGLDNKFMRTLAERARRNPKRVVFAEAESYRVLKAAQTVCEEGVCTPILLGNVNRINELLEEYTIEFGEEIEIIDPKDHALSSKRDEYGAVLFEKRKRKGLTLHEATKLMRDRNYFGAMMVEMGEADSLVSGVSRKYRDVLKPIIEIIGVQKEVEKIAGMIIMLTKRGPMFLADTTVNVNPSAEDLVNITDLVAKAVRRLKLTPRIAMLGYSNFGSSPGDEPNKMRDAVEILHQTQPNLIVDGEVQANFALNNEMLLEKFDFSTLANKQVNTLIFPNLSAGNIAYKMMQEMTDAEVVGPMLLGLKKSAHVLQLGCSVREIVTMVKIAVVDAQSKQ